ILERNQTQYRELPLEFEGIGEVKGYLFRQVYFKKDWYVYQVSRENETSHFEVFKRQESLMSKNPFAKENYISYPKSNAFGVWAWTANNVEHAIEIINKKTISDPLLEEELLD